ncbi:MAG TPA: hypothetical protein VMU04_15290 [Candidatus Acidoferrum sp.]|nr:hypothetical protein [Candidatus Acidoferrum sp.]
MRTGTRSPSQDCATGDLTIPPNLMRDLANGTALKPLPPKVEERLLQKLDPADYPTEVIQAAFEVMRRHRNFRAAWVFRVAGSHLEPGHGLAYTRLFRRHAASGSVVERHRFESGARWSSEAWLGQTGAKCSL